MRRRNNPRRIRTSKRLRPKPAGRRTTFGPYVIPKKKEEPPPPAPEKPKKIENMPDYSIQVNVPLVNLDVLVTTKDGQTIPGLKKENFKIMEDGAPQTDCELQSDRSADHGSAAGRVRIDQLLSSWSMP